MDDSWTDFGEPISPAEFMDWKESCNWWATPFSKASDVAIQVQARDVDHADEIPESACPTTIAQLHRPRGFDEIPLLCAGDMPIDSRGDELDSNGLQKRHYPRKKRH
jgi:hypothetical protein